MRNRPAILFGALIAAFVIVPTSIPFVRARTAPAGTTATATEQASPPDIAGAIASLPLNQIDAANTRGLRVPCSHETRRHPGIGAGPIRLHNALIGATGYLFSIDPATCREDWRTHEDYKPARLRAVNRLVFIGDAGGDDQGARERMYALNARTGEIVWEFCLVPRSADDPARAPQGSARRSYTLDPVTGEIANSDL